MSGQPQQRPKSATFPPDGATDGPDAKATILGLGRNAGMLFALYGDASAFELKAPPIVSSREIVAIVPSASAAIRSDAFADRQGEANLSGLVIGVFANASHSFSKLPKEHIKLVLGLGVEGDAHYGRTVQHVWDKRKDPERPNFRQVHLLDAEILAEVNAKGFQVQPGDLGENITTSGIDLRALSTGTMLHIGDEVIVEVTGLRSPCIQIERFQRGLKDQFSERPSNAPVIHKAGIMGVVFKAGLVRAGDPIIPNYAGQPVPLVAV
jgi:hypothetical protein